MRIEPLSPALLNDWLHFFDTAAFTDNADWAGCYCSCYQVNCSNKEWSSRTKEQNRTWAQLAIQSGTLQGYLAYEGSQAVGWCNVNGKTSFPLLIREKELLHDEASSKTAAIICFVISPQHRGKGIARKLLQHAIAGYAAKGVEAIEAYPYKGELSPADQFHGPLELFLSEGFSVLKEFERFSVVRKTF